VARLPLFFDPDTILYRGAGGRHDTKLRAGNLQKCSAFWQHCMKQLRMYCILAALHKNDTLAAEDPKQLMMIMMTIMMMMMIMMICSKKSCVQ
jgi:Ni,Fe-hydrogenase I cytochrome b subunit